MHAKEYTSDTLLEVADRMEGLVQSIYRADVNGKVTGEMCRDWASQLRSWANMITHLPIDDTSRPPVPTIYLDVNGI